MKLYQKILATGAVIASIGLSGCGENQCSKQTLQTLEGTVKEEFGTTQRIVESSGAIFGNESVKFGGPTYGLVLETDEGEYIINVRDIPRLKPVYALARAIEPGDKVRITYDLFTRIGNDRVGTTDSDTIELIEKAKK